MEEFSSPKQKEKKHLSRSAWQWIHVVATGFLMILFLAIPMYESKVGEDTFVYGFFFEATRGMDIGPASVYYVFFGIFLLCSLISTILYGISLAYEREGKLDRSDRYFASGAILFIASHALQALVSISLSLLIPLSLSVILAGLGFASLFLHAKRYSELAEI